MVELFLPPGRNGRGMRMERLVVKRHGRRIFGWAYRRGGTGSPFTVDLLKQGQTIAQSVANLTFLEDNPFLSIAEQRRHGFEFLLPREHLQSAPGSLHLQLRGSQVGRTVPEPDTALGSRLELHVDHVNDNGFGGWGWDPDHPDHSTTVELRLAGTPDYCLPVPANRLRPDLVSAGLARGNCGFWVRWPHQLTFSERRQTRLRLGKIEINLGAKLQRSIGRQDKLDIPGHMLSF